jgi:RHH-type proline utilization regulon transcriptional repressor/proline dehydrogenase/delta 1-pyrroline-5-carboxylate dehydrogenase
VSGATGIAPRRPAQPGERVRVVGTPPEGLRREAAEVGASLVDAPVVADGRREMLTVLREQAISRTRHRFGHVED